jgi:hypothetical protein
MVQLRSRDNSDLFARLSASDYVVTATLTKQEFIPPKPTQGELDRLKSEEEEAQRYGSGTIHVPGDMARGGILYTLAAAQTLCRQADFRPGSQQQPDISGAIYILTPWRELGADADVEGFLSGKTYLLFLEKDPAQSQFGSLYEINTTRTYYRAHLRLRGAVELPADADKGKPADFATPLLTAVTALCDAVKPADTLVKIGNLTSLRLSTDDAGLRRSAEAAIKSLEVGPTKPQ